MENALSQHLRQIGENLGRPAVAFLGMMSVSPNVLTMTGMMIGLFAAYVIWVGPWWLVAVSLILAGACDMLDGQVARATNTSSTLGTFTDSVVDRVTDMALLMSLTCWFAWQQHWVGMIFGMTATIATTLIPYCRAKAEALGLSGKAGLLSRAPRTLSLIVGLLGGSFTTILALGFVGVLGLMTVGQRFANVREQLEPSTE